MPQPIRRIVTGHDSENHAVVLIDEVATNVRGTSSPGQYTTLMWCSDTMPVEMPVGEDAEDMGARKLGTYPPVNGTRFMISEYPPGNIPKMHRTETIDYIVVLDGEIDMELDDGRMVTMKRNDVMIQRGTNHAWINRGPGICRMAFVLIDAKPLGIGDPVPRGGIVGDHK
ncbi:MAG: cupin 2 protein [Hyphomicrobiales bacterium]|jgi:quercetin dioxygenase-like cupin family protein|nr:cupin 2 protein [Hyphomicrobiales bacterium]